MPGADITVAVDGGAAFDAADLPAWPVRDHTEAQLLTDVLESGKWGSTHGDMVRTFEREFAAYQSARHSICLVNGTLAITAALRSARVGIGDEVIVPPYTFIATASAALFAGAVPVFADVDPQTHLMDPRAAEAAVTEHTKAIVVVHMAGRPADMDAFIRLASRYGLTLIEDCAQAHGAAYNGQPVGTLGDAGTFSFQSNKNMTAGEGGAVLTDSDELAGALYSAVNVGRVPGGDWYEHVSVGFNLRMTEFQAAVLRAQLARLPAQQKVRERNARALTAALTSVEGIRLPPDDPAVTSHGRHLFLFRVPELGKNGQRDVAVQSLTAEGIAASTGYRALHRNQAVVREATQITERLGRAYRVAECPVADQVAADTIWLPHWCLLGSDEQTAGIAAAVAKVITQI